MSRRIELQSVAIMAYSLARPWWWLASPLAGV
jgi:hypothetical protein